MFLDAMLRFQIQGHVALALPIKLVMSSTVIIENL